MPTLFEPLDLENYDITNPNLLYYATQYGNAFTIRALSKKNITKLEPIYLMCPITRLKKVRIIPLAMMKQLEIAEKAYSKISIEEHSNEHKLIEKLEKKNFKYVQVICWLLSDDVQLQRKAASTIRHLTFNHSANQSRYATNEVKKGLVGCLKSVDLDVQREAVLAIGQLTAYYPYCQTTSGSDEVRDALVGCLESANSDIQSYAAHAIGHFAANNPHPQESFATEQVRDALVRCLLSGHSELQHHAAYAMSALTTNKPVSLKIFSTIKVRNALVRCYISGSPIVKLHTVKAMQNLSVCNRLNAFVVLGCVLFTLLLLSLLVKEEHVKLVHAMMFMIFNVLIGQVLRYLYHTYGPGVEFLQAYKSTPERQTFFEDGNYPTDDHPDLRPAALAHSHQA